MTRLRAALMACAIVLLAGTQQASAESISLTFDKSVNGGASLSGSPTGPFLQTGPFYWDVTGTPPNTNFPSPTSTFCLQLSGALPSPGGSVSFGVVSVSADLGKAKADLITELYGRSYNTAWESSNFTGSADSVMFQVALWELATDGTKDLSTGSFQADATVFAGAQALLNALNGDTSSFYMKFGNKELVALVAPDPSDPKPQDYQDQITLRNKPPSSVPAPPSVVLAGIGILGLLGRFSWLRLREALA